MPSPNEQQDMDFPLIPGESKGERLARIASTCKGCSSRVNTPLYIDCVVRKSDRGPTRINYYLWNGPGDKLPSTCMLFFLRELERAGVIGIKAVNDPYVYGHAPADIQSLPGWSWGLPYEEVNEPQPDGTTKKIKRLRPFKKGDSFFVDDSSQQNSHYVIVRNDARVLADGSWEVDTIEGGQNPDSTGQEEFTRILKWGGMWTNQYTGVKDRQLLMGARWIYGWVDVSKLPIPTIAAAPDIDIPMPPNSEEFEPNEPSTNPQTPVSKSKAPVEMPQRNWNGIIATIVALLIAGGAVLIKLAHCKP